MNLCTCPCSPPEKKCWLRYCADVAAVSQSKALHRSAAEPQRNSVQQQQQQQYDHHQLLQYARTPHMMSEFVQHGDNDLPSMVLMMNHPLWSSRRQLQRDHIVAGRLWLLQRCKRIVDVMVLTFWLLYDPGRRQQERPQEYGQTIDVWLAIHSPGGALVTVRTTRGQSLQPNVRFFVGRSCSTYCLTVVTD